MYQYLKVRVVKNAEDKTMIIMTQMEAIGCYVRGTLRPKMFRTLAQMGSEDKFIIEAMSTTYVRREVMEIFNNTIPEYVYRRVSDRPLNPKNMADGFHLEMMRYFEENRDRQLWQGKAKIDEQEFLMHVRPIISDRSCLRCHGGLGNAPEVIFASYGVPGNPGWRENTVVGVESVSIPLEIAFADAKNVVIDVFIFGILTLGLLFGALYGAFRYLVTKPLNILSVTFRCIADGTEPLGRNMPISQKDEIGDLAESFNTLARHLLDAQERLKKTAAMERQMLETEKLAAIGQLSAGVAHEINNPLGGVKLCFNNLIETEMGEDTKKQHIEVINSGFDRIQGIVRQLLDFSRNSPLNLSPTSMNKVIENVLKLAEYTISRKGILLARELSEDIPDLMADPNKLEQVFLNLIINAVQAMDEEGVLTIKTWTDAGFCNASVIDTGRGIPVDAVIKVFNPFFTLKDAGEGTGLGLTVCKAIAEQHRGKITVETSNKGATFTVKLPLGQCKDISS